MRYFGKYNENGDYVAFYNDELHGDNIPTPNIELTETQWREAISSRCRVVDGVHTLVPATDQEILDEKYIKLRFQRDQLLSQSDWTQMPDSPLTEEQKASWATYRQSLRDLPSTVDINNIVYPEKP